TDVLNCQGIGCTVATNCGNTFTEGNYFAFRKGQDQASFVADVGCAIQQGTTGCGVEQHIDAMYFALDKTDAGQPHAGFLSDDALLAVILVTDEDDCSAPKDSWLFDGRAYAGGATLGTLAAPLANPYRNDYPTTSTGTIQAEQICAFVSEAHPNS